MYEKGVGKSSEDGRPANPVDADGDDSAEVVADGDDGGDDEAEEEHERQRAARRPDAPTKEEIAEHNLSHIPMRPWCKPCMRGKGKRRPSLNIKGDYAEGHVARVRMDYSPSTISRRAMRS